MCEFHDSNCNGLGDMWWTNKCTYFSTGNSIDVGHPTWKPFSAIRSIRQALLFAVTMVVLSVPSHFLLSELQEDMTETRGWLQGLYRPF